MTVSGVDPATERFNQATAPKTPDLERDTLIEVAAKTLREIDLRFSPDLAKISQETWREDAAEIVDAILAHQASRTRPDLQP